MKRILYGMRDTFRRVVRALTPSKPTLTEAQLATGSSYVSSILIYFIGFSLFFTSFHLSFGLTAQGKEIANLIMSGIAGSAILALGVFRISNSKSLSISALLLVLSAVALVTTRSLGGIQSPSMVLFVIIAISGVVLGGARVGLAWSSICITLVFYIFSNEAFNNTVIQIIPEYKYNLSLAVAWASSIFTTSIIVVWYQVTTVTMQQKINSANEQLTHIARHDALTQLPNRLYFYQRIELLCKDMKAGQTFAVMILDLNGFKKINDSYGHGVGDMVLQHVAKNLRSALRQSDFVARLGGDEFAVLIEKNSTYDEVSSIAKKLRSAVECPVEIRNTAHQVSTSIGMAIFPDHGQDIDRLVEHADKAMYADKESH